MNKRNPSPVPMISLSKLPLEKHPTGRTESKIKIEIRIRTHRLKIDLDVVAACVNDC